MYDIYIRVKDLESFISLQSDVAFLSGQKMNMYVKLTKYTQIDMTHYMRKTWSWKYFLFVQTWIQAQICWRLVHKMDGFFPSNTVLMRKI